MRVLDLDLDFFVDPIKLDAASDGPRLDDAEFKPRSETDVRAFLEDCCGLSTSQPVPGKRIVHHHEAFGWWRDLIDTNRLTPPFEVVHVDAHADMGVSLVSYTPDFIGCDLMHRPLAERRYPSIGFKAMNAGNYLLAAIACEWLSRLTFVAHDDNTGDDVPGWIFDCKATALEITLPKYQPGVFVGGLAAQGRPVIDRGFPVPFEFCYASDFVNAGAFDYVVVAESPAFTPRAADALLPVINEYLQLQP